MILASVLAFIVIGCTPGSHAAPSVGLDNPDKGVNAQTPGLSAKMQDGGDTGKTKVGDDKGAKDGSKDDTKPPKNDYRRFQLADLKVTPLKIGKNKFRIWVMDDPDKREEGMMFLSDTDVKADQGMLFVFAEPEALRFWMKNTYIPLDIAYIDKDKVILNVLTMKEFDIETDYSSKGESKYALEVKAGVFKKLGIKAGMKVEFSDKIKAEK